MAVVAQLVEQWFVVPSVAGSIPVDRPIQILQQYYNKRHILLSENTWEVFFYFDSLVKIKTANSL